MRSRSPHAVRRARTQAALHELASVAYRTRRAFRAQYELLVAASIFEEAAARLDAPPGAFGRHLRRRVCRDFERRRDAFADQLEQFRTETLRLLAPSDLLPDVERLVLSPPAALDRNTELSGSATSEPGAPARAPALFGKLASAALGKPSAYVAAAAWAATADELLTRGITNRPSLIVAELTAVVLTPVAIFQPPDGGRRE
jgi:hypothetical protein